VRRIPILDIPELKGKAVLLFQDMFPITNKYLSVYSKNAVDLYVSTDNTLDRTTKNARYCCR